MATSAEFTEKTALITGGSRGIGRATTLRLASEGARVAINFMTREEEARQTLAEVEQAGGTGILVQGDVSKPAEAAAMVAATREALGPIDLLAHCAGMAVVEPADETRWESWKRTMEVNLDGSFNVLTGDGSLLMSMGSLVTVMATGCAILTVILLDNNIYDVTVGKKTVASDLKMDYLALARSIGFPTAEGFSDTSGWNSAVSGFLQSRGPRWAWLRVDPALPDDMKTRQEPMQDQLARIRRELAF